MTKTNYFGPSGERLYFSNYGRLFDGEIYTGFQVLQASDGYDILKPDGAIENRGTKIDAEGYACKMYLNTIK